MPSLCHSALSPMCRCDRQVRNTARRDARGLRHLARSDTSLDRSPVTCLTGSFLLNDRPGQCRSRVLNLLKLPAFMDGTCSLLLRVPFPVLVGEADESLSGEEGAQAHPCANPTSSSAGLSLGT